MPNCTNCTEECPQAEMANDIAKGRMFAEREFVNLINKIENGTLVEVVRCKECKWWRGPIYGNRCSYHSGPNHTEFYDADEFCSRGERKGGDE